MMREDNSQIELLREQSAYWSCTLTFNFRSEQAGNFFFFSSYFISRPCGSKGLHSSLGNVSIYHLACCLSVCLFTFLPLCVCLSPSSVYIYIYVYLLINIYTFTTSAYQTSLGKKRRSLNNMLLWWWCNFGWVSFCNWLVDMRTRTRPTAISQMENSFIKMCL